jgi:FkbM family methyltransferase
MSRIRFLLKLIINLGRILKSSVYRHHASRQCLKSFDLPGSIGKQTIKSLLPENPVIVEVGAHVGIDTLEFGVMYPKGRIISFEPQKDLFVAAVERTWNAENVSIFPYAISSEYSLQKFYVSSGASTGSSSLLNPTKHLEHHPDVQFDENDSQMVVTVPLGEACKELGIQKIDLLWIDTQGAELLVLKGAAEMLPHTSFIYLECSVDPLYEGGASYDEIKTFLSAHGFQLEKEYMPPDWGGEGNALFSR